MENKKLTLNLIRNTYESDEAKTIINQLLSDKICFIQRQIFSLEERLGIDSPFLKNRLKELNESKEQLEEFLNNTSSDEMQVKIDCPINIELVNSSFNSNESSLKEEKSWI